MFFQLTNYLFYYIEVLICDLRVNWEREASGDKKRAQTMVVWAVVLGKAATNPNTVAGRRSMECRNAHEEGPNDGKPSFGP